MTFSQKCSGMIFMIGDTKFYLLYYISVQEIFERSVRKNVENQKTIASGKQC